jgi:hypothetical protein
MFGVYSATNPSVSINGQVSYTARDASVLVQGKADETGAGISASNFSAVPATKDFSSLTKVTSGKRYLDWTNGETSNDNTDNFSDWTDLDLNFVEDSSGVKDITIGFYMTNYSNYPVKATINVKKSIENVEITDMYQVAVLDTYQQSPESELVKITLSLIDDSVKVDGAALDVQVSFEKLTSTKSKLNFTYAGSGTSGYYKATIKSDAEGDIVYPATYNDGEHGELSVRPNGETVLGAAIQVYTKGGYTIEEAAYTQKNEKITSVIVWDGITTLEMGAFAVLTKMTNAILPDTIRYIGAGAFACCDSLTKIELPNQLVKMDSYDTGKGYVGAFFACKSLKSVTIPTSVTVIGSGTFYNCESLESVVFDVLKGKCEAIGFYAFMNCALTSIVLPKSLVEIQPYGLYMSSLKRIFILAIEPPGGEHFISDSIEEIVVRDLDAYKTAEGWSTYADKMVLFD